MRFDHRPCWAGFEASGIQKREADRIFREVLGPGRIEPDPHPHRAHKGIRLYRREPWRRVLGQHSSADQVAVLINTRMSGRPVAKEHRKERNGDHPRDGGKQQPLRPGFNFDKFRQQPPSRHDQRLDDVSLARRPRGRDLRAHHFQCFRFDGGEIVLRIGLAVGSMNGCPSLGGALGRCD
jgi:hypothetical protein